GRGARALQILRAADVGALALALDPKPTATGERVAGVAIEDLRVAGVRSIEVAGRLLGPRGPVVIGQQLGIVGRELLGELLGRGRQRPGRPRGSAGTKRSPSQAQLGDEVLGPSLGDRA